MRIIYFGAMRGISKAFAKYSHFVQKMAENVALQTTFAQNVVENLQTNKYSVEHEARLRQKVNMDTAVSSIEKELRQEIARSLRRSEDKVAVLIQRAAESKNQMMHSAMSLVDP